MHVINQFELISFNGIEAIILNLSAFKENLLFFMRSNFL